MAILPKEIKTTDAIKVFESVGFASTMRSGSHEKLKRAGPNGTVQVVHPKMRIGLLKRLINDAGMTTTEFMKIYNDL